MTASTLQPAIHPVDDDVKTLFTQVLLPRVQRCARVAFQDVRCSDRRADCTAEAAALAWKWLLRLQARGKDVTRFPTTFAALAVRAVRCGRRLCGQEKARDCLSFQARQRGGFRVETLAAVRRPYDELHASVRGQANLDAYEERLRENAVTPPPEAAAFRIDFPRFLSQLSPRDRKLAQYLALGHPAMTAARYFGLSPARVTQLRQHWCREWRAFQGEAPPSRS